MGIVVFLGIAVLVAIACHRWVRPFLLALLISGPLAAVVFQVVVTIQLGYRDPFFLIASFITTWVGWGISLAVGLMMRYLPFDAAGQPGKAAAQRPSHGNGEGLPTERQR